MKKFAGAMLAAAALNVGAADDMKKSGEMMKLDTMTK
jgi:hypothetical protein